MLGGMAAAEQSAACTILQTMIRSLRADHEAD
jgi:hypothetical protein